MTPDKIIIYMNNLADAAAIHSDDLLQVTSTNKCLTAVKYCLEVTVHTAYKKFQRL